MKILKMIPVFNKQGDDLEKVEAWVTCPSVCKKITMVYKPELQCSIDFANAASEYIRTRVMIINGKETILISLKQADEIILPKGVDFNLESFICEDKNGEKYEIPYKILILDEEV